MLGNLIKSVCKNAGGIRYIWFIPVEYVLSITENESYVVTADPVLETGKDFFYIEATEDSLNLSEKQGVSEDGKFFELSIPGFFPGDDPQSISIFDEMSDRRFIVKTEDNDGRVRLCGTIENGLRFRHDFDTMSKSSDRKGTSFTFYGNYDFRQFFFELAIPEDRRITTEDEDRITSDGYYRIYA